MKFFKLLTVTFVSVLFTLSAKSQNFINHKGQDLFLSGINVAWINYGNDLTGFDSQKWTAICEDVASAGGNSLRWWLHVDGRSTPTYDPQTNLVTGIDAKALDNLALALDIAAEHGLVVSLCLWAHGMLVKNDSGDQSSSVGKARIAKNKKLLTEDEATQAYIDNALIPMVEKVKNHTAILCWEIFNEPEGMTDLSGWTTTEHIDMSYIQKFVNRCAGAIHRTDPNAKVSNGNWYILSTANYETGGNQGKNYYTDSALVANGGDPDGYLDFFMFHYYPSERGQAYSPFHKTYDYFTANDQPKDRKPIIIGEFPAHGIVKTQGSAWLLPVTAQKNTTKAMLWLYQNGYAGGWGWTYSAHDGNGGLDDMRESMDTLRKLYPEHIIVKHDENFNYMPFTKGKLADTIVFVGSEKIMKYANVNDYFGDDPNDPLKFSCSFDENIISVEIDDDGFINFEAKATETDNATITISATDKGDKTVSLTFYVFIRDNKFDSDNKLLHAWVVASSIENDLHPQYFATDGDTTRWSSLYEDDQYLLFDMFNEYEIQRLVLNWEWTGEKGAYAQAYNIEVSNDKEHWDTVFAVSKGQTIKSNIILEKPVTCRYIKITFTERATEWGYSLTEVEAYKEINDNHPTKVVSKQQIYQACYTNELFSYQKNLRTLFSDEDYDVLSISTTDMPNWLNFDPERLTISGIPQAADTGTTIFKIIAQDYAGTSASKEFKVKVFPAQTAIATIDNQATIYPNPCFKDSFTITIPNANGKALASFSNADGKLAAIKYAIFTNGQATFLTDGLAKGIYAVSIRINGETFKSKVIIE